MIRTIKNACTHVTNRVKVDARMFVPKTEIKQLAHAQMASPFTLMARHAFIRVVLGMVVAMTCALKTEIRLCAPAPNQASH
jgi:hypothetical protein